MPEGPEVEKVRQDLLPLKGKTIESSYFTQLALKYTRYSDQEIGISSLRHSKLQDIERKGKYLIWKTSGNDNHYILNHLGMTGSWILFNDRKELKKYLNREKKNYCKVVIEFTDGISSVFEDMRNFGRFHLFNSLNNLKKKYSAIKEIGLDGFKFSLEDFRELLNIKRNVAKPLGILLLDQRFVAGIGNIYKSESLWRAKISPLATPEELSALQVKTLAESIQGVLYDAFKDGGSTISNFQSNRSEGKAQEWHAVYSKEGKTCLRCNNIIKKIVQVQRSTFYCDLCQKDPKTKI
jgi:formamidopyrimidine-DNA glycosylase